MTREELIAALEAATGPSLALDLEIKRVCEVPHDPRCLALQYTASIDAALTLLPEGRQAVVYTAGGADVWPATAGMHLHDMTYAATPAIALCIAALKAQGDGA